MRKVELSQIFLKGVVNIVKYLCNNKFILNYFNLEVTNIIQDDS